MPPILSACLVMYRCGDEIDVALRCIQNADLEVADGETASVPEDDDLLLGDAAPERDVSGGFAAV